MRNSPAPSLILSVLLLAGCTAPTGVNILEHSSAPATNPSAASSPGTNSIVLDPSGTVSVGDQTPQQLEAKIAAGDMNAAFELGAMYHDGQGVTQDFGKALALFEQAGNAGERRSQYNAGLMYLRGEGTAVDNVAARRWFTQAMDAGNPLAPYQLALLSYQGLGTAKDLGKAKEYFEKSALQGVAEAEYNLGIMYILGQGTAQDVVEGYAWLAVARTYGYDKAVTAIKNLEKNLTPAMIKDGQTRAQELSQTVESNKAVQKAQAGT